MSGRRFSEVVRACLRDDGPLTAVRLEGGGDCFFCSLRKPKEAEKPTSSFNAASNLDSSKTMFLTFVVREGDKEFSVAELEARGKLSRTRRMHQRAVGVSATQQHGLPEQSCTSPEL